MKLFVFIFISASLKISSAADIVCLYSAVGSHWETQQYYVLTKFSGKDFLGSVSLGTREVPGQEAFCSRATEAFKDGAQIFEQAHYIVETPMEMPEAQTCNFKNGTVFKTLARYETPLKAGAWTQIGNQRHQLIHYVPTAAEIKSWEKGDTENLVLQKCLSLMPSSVPTVPNASRLGQINIYEN